MTDAWEQDLKCSKLEMILDHYLLNAVQNYLSEWMNDNDTESGAFKTCTLLGQESLFLAFFLSPSDSMLPHLWSTRADPLLPPGSECLSHGATSPLHMGNSYLLPMLHSHSPLSLSLCPVLKTPGDP